MRHLISTLTLIIGLACPAHAQDTLRWSGLDADTRDTLMRQIAESDFDLQGMRALSVTTGTCPAECSLLRAACACPKLSDACPDTSRPSDKGALCLSPVEGILLNLEDGRTTPALSLP